MSESKITTTETTTVSVEELDDLLGTPSADSVMIANEGGEQKDNKKKSPNFFQKDKVDMKFLDQEEEEEKEEEEEQPQEPEKEKENFDDVLSSLEEDEEEEEEGGQPGRPKLNKAGMAQLIQSLVDDKIILPFADEDKKLEDYTMEDYKELIQMNFQSKEEQIKTETPKQFFESLPPELQYAAKYVADGGKDLKGLFKALAQSEDTKSISIDDERGQETAVRQFLQASGFGTDEEIEDQINSWKDLEQLEAKARQFKPKLDAMQDEIIQRQVKEQEIRKKQREDQSRQYADSIYDTLAIGELNGIKLNNKVQNMLYTGLIQPNHQSVSGQPTNLFGHLIEKHQFVEPNHGLIAEALWLLADPDGYKAEVAKTAVNDTNANTARKLKQAEANKNSTSVEEQENNNSSNKKSGIQRPSKNFFQR